MKFLSTIHRPTNLSSRHLKNVGSLVLGCLLALGCGKDEDSPSFFPEPMEVRIVVQDSEGGNILDPLIDGNISQNEISATFQGRTYPRDKSDRATLSLRTITDESNDPVLLFGEIHATMPLDGEPLVLDWGDGTSTEISLYNSWKWSIDNSPVLERHLIYDSKDWVDLPNIVVVKK